MTKHITMGQSYKEFFSIIDVLQLTFNFRDALQYNNAIKSLEILRQSAMRLSNLSEKESNGVPDVKNRGGYKWDDRDQLCNDEAVKKAEVKAINALKSVFNQKDFHRIDIQFLRDPRGPSIIISDKSSRQRLASFW